MSAPYPQEFRDDVVRVARSHEDGVTIAQIPKNFDGHEMALHKWVRQAAIDDGNRPCRAGRSRSSCARRANVSGCSSRRTRSSNAPLPTYPRRTC